MTERGTVAVDGLQRERAYELLSHGYRRALLACLDGREEGVALADAAGEVARRSGPAHGEVTRGTVGDVYTALYHSHVPLLVEAGVVDHDADRNVVALTERGERLAGVRERLAAPVDAPQRRTF